VLTIITDLAVDSDVVDNGKLPANPVIVAI